MTTTGTDNAFFRRRDKSFSQHDPPTVYDSKTHPDKSSQVPALPDLRFEWSYLKNAQQYVHVERLPSEIQVLDEKEGAELVVLRERIDVEWGRLVWVTVRDQVISPFLQGALWGVASLYLRPLGATLGRSIRAWWARGATYTPGKKQVEGHGAGWLRSRVSSLTTGQGNTTNSRY